MASCHEFALHLLEEFYLLCGVVLFGIQEGHVITAGIIPKLRLERILAHVKLFLHKVTML